MSKEGDGVAWCREVWEEYPGNHNNISKTLRGGGVHRMSEEQEGLCGQKRVIEGRRAGAEIQEVNEARWWRGS